MRHTRISPEDRQFLYRPTALISGLWLFSAESTTGEAVTYADLRDKVIAAVRARPYWRQRIRFRGRVLPPIWEEDAAFDPARHVSSLDLETAATMPELVEAMSAELATGLDWDHPLWRITFVESVEGYGPAVLTTTHHVVTDGMGFVAMFGELLSSGPGRTHPSREHTTVPSADPLVEMRRSEAGFLPKLGRMAEVLTQSRQYAPWPKSVRRAEPAEGWETELWTGSLVELKLASRSLGVTINDILVAAFGGAVRSQIPSSFGDDVSATVPVSMRGTGSPHELGNHLGMFAVHLGVGAPDALRRLRFVSAQLQAWKIRDYAPTAQTILRILGLLPHSLLKRTLAALAGPGTGVTNLADNAGPLELSGHPLQRFHFASTHEPTAAVWCAIASVNDQVCATFTLSATLLPRPSDFVAAFADSLAELCEFGRRVEALTEQRLFSALNQVQIDSLARTLEPLSVAPGQELMVAGDATDERYFLITEGEVEVAGGDGDRRRVRAPTAFGEIAPLARTQRTSTVTATSPLAGYVLGGDQLRTAVRSDSTSRYISEAVLRQSGYAGPVP